MIHTCGLYEDATGEEKIRIEHSLSIGAGCCSSLNSYRLPILQKLDSDSSPHSSTTY